VKHGRGLSIPTTLQELCDPRHTALLVYDMQNGICSQVVDSDCIVRRCQHALEVARSAGMRVVFTRHMSCPLAWMGTTQMRTAMAWQRTADPESVKPWFLRDSAGFDVVSELAPRADELILDKLSMSAFEGTPLAFVLQDCNVLSVAIAGIALEIGIEPTVRHATDLGFIPIVLTDACGAGHVDAGTRSLEVMKFVGEAVISDVDSFSAALYQSGPSVQS
jgi:biuret amidohydrolase